MPTESQLLPRIPEYVGTITVDLGHVYPHRVDKEIEVKLYRVVPDAERYGRKENGRPKQAPPR